MTTHSQTLQEHQDKMLLRMARIGDIDDKLIYIIRLSEPNNVPHFTFAIEQLMAINSTFA